MSRLHSNVDWSRFSSVRFILVFQIAIILVHWWLFGNHAPLIVPDSHSYLDFTRATMLDHVRTIGYPLFLKCVRVVDPKLNSLSTLQLSIHLLSVFLFAVCLRHFHFSKLTTLAVASPMLYAPAIRDAQSFVLTDALGCSVAILVLCCFFLALRRPSSWGRWGLLGFMVFADYSIRPAYLFLVGLIPLLSVIVGLLRYGIRQGRRIFGALLLRSFLVCALPFFLFSAMRSVLISHFGVVSFGGYNMIGIMSQFVDSNDVARVSAEFRPLTSYLLAEQRNRHLIQVNENNQRILSYREIMANYNFYIHQLIVPYLNEQGLKKPSEIDQFLNHYVGALFELHKDLYFQWLQSAFTFALGRIPDPMFNFFLALSLLGFYVLRIIMSNATTGMPARDWQVAVIAVIGFGFLVSKLLLVIAVELPIDRYLLPVYLFLPSILLAGLVKNVTSTEWRNLFPLFWRNGRDQQ